MTAPQPEPNVYAPLIAAIEGLNSHTREQTVEIKNLAEAVLDEASARDKKILALQRLTAIMVCLGIMLLLIAGLNFYNTSRSYQTARTTQNTNDLLVSCFQPGTNCSNANQAAQNTLNTEIRQTTFVLFVCSRLNPADPDNPDPQGNTAKLVKCVQGYYPDFKLPAKSN